MLGGYQGDQKWGEGWLARFLYSKSGKEVTGNSRYEDKNH